MFVQSDKYNPKGLQKIYKIVQCEPGFSLDKNEILFNNFQTDAKIDVIQNELSTFLFNFIGKLYF